MGLSFIRQPAPDDGHVIATARLCLTEDGRLVPDTDPDARWLFCVPGAPISRADAERYGLLGQDEPAEKPEPAKARPAPVNKARAKTADK